MHTGYVQYVIWHRNHLSADSGNYRAGSTYYVNRNPNQQWNHRMSYNKNNLILPIQCYIRSLSIISQLLYIIYILLNPFTNFVRCLADNLENEQNRFYNVTVFTKPFLLIQPLPYHGKPLLKMSQTHPLFSVEYWMYSHKDDTLNIPPSKYLHPLTTERGAPYHSSTPLR